MESDASRVSCLELRRVNEILTLIGGDRRELTDSCAAPHLDSICDGRGCAQALAGVSLLIG
jgi:hypothetical protein